MAEFKITDLTEIISDDIVDGDLLEIVDLDADASRKVSIASLTSSLVTTDAVTGAGALMDSELASIADVKALDQSVVSGAAPVFDASNMTNIPTTNPSGSDTQVQFNDGGEFAGNAGFKYSNGVVLVAQNATHTPLSITGAASQSGNYFTIDANGDTGGKLFRLDSSGSLKVGFGNSYDGQRSVQVFNSSANALANTSLLVSANNSSFTLTAYSSGKASAGLTKANQAVINASGDGGMAFGTSNASGELFFYTGGLGGGNKRMSITAAGLVGIGVTPVTTFDINGNSVRVRTDRTIATTTDSGYKGEISWDSNYIYVAVADNSWKKVALSSI